MGQHLNSDWRADVVNVNSKKCLPILTIIALLCAPLGYIAGAAYCHRAVETQVNTAEYKSEDAKEDTLRFAGLAVVVCSIQFGIIGAGVGLLLSGLAHSRNEVWLWLRIVAFAGNLCLFCFGVIHYVLPFLF